MTRPLPILALFVAALLAACGRPAQVDADRGRELYQRLLDADSVEIHVSEVLRTAGEHAVDAIRARGDHDAVVVPFGTPSDRTRPRLLLGRIDEPEITVLLSPLGVEVVDGGFRLHGRDYQRPDDALVAVVPDPDRAGLPATVVAANDAAALDRAWRLLVPSWRPSLHVVRRGEVELVATLSGRWPSEVFVTEDRQPTWEAAADRWTTIERGALRLRAEEQLGMAKLVNEYVRAAEAAHLRAVGWTGVPTGEVVVEGTVHTSAESMVALLGSVDLGRLSPIGSNVHTLVTREFHGDGGRALAEAAVLKALGEPAEPWMLEGLGVHASGRWWTWPLDDWVALLHNATLASTVAELTASDFAVPIETVAVPDFEAIAELLERRAEEEEEAGDEEAGEEGDGDAEEEPADPRPMIDVATSVPRSVHRRAPQRGVLFRYLLETRGVESVRALWRGEAVLEITDELELGFHRYLDELREERAESLQQARLARFEKARERREVRGVRLLPPRALDGLAGLDGSNALADLQRAGANTLMLPVFAFVNRPRPSHPYEALAGPAAWPADPGADRRDEELLLFGLRARAAGLSIALAPDLLESAYAGLAAHDKNLVSVPDWVSFLTRYSGFVEHYALLAELGGVQILNLGTELGPATDSRTDLRDVIHPDPEVAERILEKLDPVHRAERIKKTADAQLQNRLGGARMSVWGAMLERCRRIFAGLTTYTPSNGDERERIGFWMQLDVVGAAWFQPLESIPSKPGEETDAELEDERLDNAQPPTLSHLEKALITQLGTHTAWARKGRRQLLVTGAGFPGTVDSWQRPGVRRGATDPEGRLRYLRAMADTLTRARKEFNNFSGVILWSWAVDPVDDSRLARGHLLSAPGARELLPVVFGLGRE